MADVKLYEKFKKKVKETQKREYTKAELGYAVVVDGDYWRDFRDCKSLKRGELDKVESLFGTDNSLFAGDKKILMSKWEQGESCQYSSAVWCREALRGNPDRNVHEYERDEIARLYRWNPPKTWPWKDDVRNWEKARNLLRTVMKVGLWGPSIKSYDKPTVLKKAMAAYGKATIIQMRSHVIACYSEGKGKMYFFDNTAGCLLFKDVKVAEKWIEWVCECNDEGDRKTWIGVTCGLMK